MNNLEAWKMLIEDYTPTTKVILQKLETLDSAEDKIHYLRSEEIKYLINVTLNPNLCAASGVVTTNNPQKAGLDRWIEYKIREIELFKKQGKKGKMTSYLWQNNPDKELSELYNLMIDKYKLIAPETTPEQFKAVFTGQPIDEDFEPIRWHQDNASELLYFIDRLEQSNNIEHNPKRADYQRLTACFFKPNGQPFEAHMKSLKTNIEINLSPDKQKAIDELVSNF